MMLYRFQCWEHQNPTYHPSLVVQCTRTGRVAYFESFCDLTLDITSMAVTAYETEGEPLIAVSLSSQHGRHTLYAPLRELADEIAGAQHDTLWRLLKAISLQLPSRHRLA